MELGGSIPHSQYPESRQFLVLIPTSLKSILISSHLRLGLPNKKTYTNSMTYGTRRLNAAFTRTPQ